MPFFWHALFHASLFPQQQHIYEHERHEDRGDESTA